MKSRLKLFVWTDFFPDYSGGLAVAIAKDESEARAMIETECGCSVYDWGTLTVHRVDRRFSAFVTGGS